jgi:hypothetical protein
MQLDELGLYDIYGIQNVPFWQKKWFMVLILVVVVLLIIVSTYALYHWYLSRKKIRPFYEQALFDLAQLKKNQLVNSENAKNFYHHVTMIIKQYLFNEWRYDCLSYTDSELINFLQQSSDDIKLFTPEIVRLLQGSELIKFADDQVTDYYVLQDYQVASSFIKKLHSLKNTPKS